jgi:DNA-binding HxlR family transcriptional regulator
MSRCRRCAPVPEEVRRAADLLGRRWLLQIVYAAHGGATRFNEFRYALRDDIPPRTLAARLAELEAAGLLRRTVVEDARPPLVEYTLTEQGESLRALLEALRIWADSAARDPAPHDAALARVSSTG